MRDLPTNIYSVESVRAIDRIAIDDHGVPGYDLMQRAAEAAIDDAIHEFPGARRWAVICGAGNNAGDGYVVARLAVAAGYDVSVTSVVDPETLTGDAATAYSDFADGGGSASIWSGHIDGDADLLIDAIFGSGLTRDVGGRFRDAIEAMNAHPAPVHAMDIPSGICGDTGCIRGVAVRADITTTFVGLKAGLYLADGPDHCGKIAFAGLSIDPDWYADLRPVFTCLEQKDVQSWLRPRSRAAHKGDFGHLLVIGGGPGMPGAARLCAEAALRTGAGRVSVASHPDHAMLIAATRPEIMSHAVTDEVELAALMANADTVAFGPGLGQSEWAQRMLHAVETASLPAVWDADALNLLAKSPGVVANRIITPHPGEAARLLATTAGSIQADRKGSLDALVKKFGGVAVLKGAGTLVSTPSGVPRLCTSGNPGMAAPGMGDVLTGVIAALVAQGLELQDAAALGVDVHARAGDIAAEQGERGLLASDVIKALRRVVNP